VSKKSGAAYRALAQSQALEEAAAKAAILAAMVKQSKEERRKEQNRINQQRRRAAKLGVEQDDDAAGISNTDEAPIAETLTVDASAADADDAALPKPTKTAGKATAVAVEEKAPKFVWVVESHTRKSCITFLSTFTFSFILCHDIVQHSWMRFRPFYRKEARPNLTGRKSLSMSSRAYDRTLLIRTGPSTLNSAMIGSLPSARSPTQLAVQI
jgi:hypothetical protein